MSRTGYGIVSSFVILINILACPPTEKGFTDCNGTTCQPGQYCFGGGVCNDGCLSAVNCAEGQECEDEESFEAHGTCVDTDTSSGEGEGEGESITGHDETCDGYVTFARECGLLASEAEAIRLECDQLTVDQQTLLVACAASSSCGELLSCSGLECFKDDQCPANEHCLTRADVVDPFTDVPYNCR